MDNYIEQKKNTYLYFSIGESNYAVNTNNVLEIMKLPALDYPQRLPNNTLGLLRYNKFVINIIDIRFYLDIKVTPYNIQNELIIVKTDEVIFGIITDKIIGIKPFEQALINQIPYIDNKIVIDSMYKDENGTISIVNIYALENMLKQHNGLMTEVDVCNLFPQDNISKKIMRDRSDTNASKTIMRFVPEELYAKNKYISFNLNEDFYCIELNYVKEVLKDANITNVPGTPDYIEGIINLRGDYITVINLKRFLALSESDMQDKSPVIIVEYNELTLALLIDRINELFDYQEDAQNEQSDSYYISEFAYNKNLYTVLNIEKICSDKKIIMTDT